MSYLDIVPSGGDTGRPMNLAKRLAIIERFGRTRGRRVLDCGCGTGQYVSALLKGGADAYGIEYEAVKVEECLTGRPDLAGRVTKQNVEAMEFLGNSFDIVLLNEVLEHVTNENRALVEIHRVLKSQGLLFVFSPNRLYPFETHPVYSKRSNRKLPIYTPLLPYVPLHLGKNYLRYTARNYWPRHLRGLIRDTGFAIEHTAYVWQTFENISGEQPGAVSILKPLARAVSAFLEKVPFVNAFGVSQVVVARKTVSAAHHP